MMLLIGLSILGGCTGTPVPLDRATREQAAEDVRERLPRDEVAGVLASGFYTISERALKPVSVRALGLEGMRGLATLDPEIIIEEDSGMINVFYGDHRVKTVVEPLDYDSESWADAVYEVVQALWPYSVDVAATNSERIYEAVFDAALSNLDIFSRYAGQEEAETYRDRRDGFGGLGLSLRKNDERFLVSFIDRHGPAYKAGVRKGDMLISVNAHPVIGRSLRTVREWLRGKIQTEVELEIERPDTGIAQKLYAWRELVIPQTVWSRYRDGVLIARISGFNEKTVSSLLHDVQEYIVQYDQALKGIVLDLRGNPGGLLKRAVQVADLFIAGGRIISTKGRHPDSFEYYEADGRDVAQGRPLVVLLNGKSASASEIVAAALQDRQRAVVVGSSSYGKGTVQSVQRLPNDGEITITWSRLIAPSGYSFHGLGVRPSVCTSGVTLKPEQAAPLFEMDGSALLAHWRSVAINDRKGRQDLRNTCTPDPNKKGIDLTVAGNIVRDYGLYKRLTGSATLATIAQ